LREHRFDEVLATAQAVLERSPGHREALLCTAIGSASAGRYPSFTTLASLEQHHPQFSRLYEERGRCFVALRKAQPAIGCIPQGVNINHALPGSWGMLEGLLPHAGRGAERRPGGEPRGDAARAAAGTWWLGAKSLRRR